MIISVKEARKRLGKEGNAMSDEEVVELVNQLDELAKLLLDMYMEQKIIKKD